MKGMVYSTNLLKWTMFQSQSYLHQFKMFKMVTMSIYTNRLIDTMITGVLNYPAFPGG